LIEVLSSSERFTLPKQTGRLTPEAGDTFLLHFSSPLVASAVSVSFFLSFLHGAGSWGSLHSWIAGRYTTNRQTDHRLQMGKWRHVHIRRYTDGESDENTGLSEVQLSWTDHSSCVACESSGEETIRLFRPQ